MRACALTTLLVTALITPGPAFAQMQSRATEAPAVDASGQAWFQLREPLQLGSDLYYQAGATVFFNGNVMVRTGHYNGVPVYADATLEPYSVVYVPVGRGLVQPYERPRRGVLAGTAGSHLSAFPVQLLGAGTAAMAATAPTQLPLSAGAVPAFTPEPSILTPLVAPAAPALVVAPAVALAARTLPDEPAFTARVILTPFRPANNDGVWVRYDNEQWVSAGRAEARTSAFQQVGTHGGAPVLRRADTTGNVIYLQSREGWVAPYRRKG